MLTMRFFNVWIAILLSPEVKAFIANLHCVSIKGNLYLVFGGIDKWMVNQSISDINLEYRKQRFIDTNKTVVRIADTFWYNGNVVWKVGNIYEEYTEVLYFRFQEILKINTTNKSDVKTMERFQYAHSAISNKIIENTWNRAWVFRNEKHCFKHHNIKTMIKGRCRTLEMFWIDNDYSALVDPIIQPILKIGDGQVIDVCKDHTQCECKNNVCYYKQTGLLKPNQLVRVCFHARQAFCTEVYSYCEENEDHISWFILLIIFLSIASTIFGTVVLLMCKKRHERKIKKQFRGNEKENLKGDPKNAENETELL